MRSLRYVHLAAAPALAAFVFACTSAPPLPKGSSIDDNDDDRDSRRDDDLSTSKPVADAAPPPPPPVADAGVPATPDAAVPANAQSCPQLSVCCGRLTDYLDRLACIGVALADDPSVCQPALVVCQGGGVGIGGYFDGTGGGACSELAGCCRQMQQRGDQAAYSCEKWVQYNDDNECYYTHQDYRQQRRCN